MYYLVRSMVGFAAWRVGVSSLGRGSSHRIWTASDTMSSERTSATVRLRYPAGWSVPQALSEQAVAQPRVVPLAVPLERIGSIDLLRILAALGIIWFHIGDAPYRQIGYAGLPVFLLVFFSLVTRKAAAHTASEFLRRRWHRLLKPWLFWSVVYGLCRLTKAICVADLSSLHHLASWETVLAGTCIHLWDLPYAFVGGLVVHVLNRRVRTGESPAVTAGLAVFGVLVLFACAADMARHTLAPPLPQWEFGLAALPLGVALGRCLTPGSRRRRNLLLSLVGGITLAGCAILGLLGFAGPALPYGLAIALVCLAYGWQTESRGLVAALAPLTLGIYLLHPLLLYGLRGLFAPPTNYPVLVILTAGICGLVVLGLMRTPLRKFV
jgi:peptidoglycan/LPS O-acetylase OafA/YrhL